MAETMKGYVFKDVNDLRLEDRPIPTLQDPRDAIVRVALSSICASDFHIKVGAVPSANKDIILGHEFAGEVVAVGDACKKIKVGDRVVANVVDRHDERGQFALDHGWAEVFINSKKEDVEARVKELTEGRGADAVIEAAGKDGTFQLAWKIARPNAVISLLAMYEEDQVLPLPSMYGKNLTWKSGGVDACKDAYLVQLISEGKLDPTPLFNKEYTLNEIAQVYEDFAVKRDGLIKPVIKPYEY